MSAGNDDDENDDDDYDGEFLQEAGPECGWCTEPDRTNSFLGNISDKSFIILSTCDNLSPCQRRVVSAWTPRVV